MLTDVRRGFVTVEGAERDYGVVIRDDEVDKAATDRLRAEQAPMVGDSFFGHSPGRVEFESRWTLNAYDKFFPNTYRS